MCWTYPRSSAVAETPRTYLRVTTGRQNTSEDHIPTDLPASAELITAPGGAVFVRPDPAPEGASVMFFTRLGGVSESPFDSLNVSLKYGDDESHVEVNRDRVKSATAGLDSAFVRQIAGDRVVRVEGPGYAGEADALVTSEPDLPLEVGVADCVPIALVGMRQVAMVHSGWRGTLSDIAGKAARMMLDGGEERLSAYIGPSIRRCCYEVSPELAASFAKEFGEGVVTGRHLSLQKAVAVGLRRSGVEEIHDIGLCTGCRSDLFFSHRMQKPLTGRSLAVVMRIGRET